MSETGITTMASSQPQQRRKAFKKLLGLAQRCSGKGRVKLVKGAPNWFIHALIRGCSLYTRGLIPLKKAAQRKLKPYRKEVKYLSGCRSSKKARKKLVQHGGVFPALIPLLAMAGKAIAGAAIGFAAKKAMQKAASRK